MKHLKWAIPCLLVVALIPYLITGVSARHTCVICRAQRADLIYFGKTWQSEYSETACTAWYRNNVEPAHKHVWVRSISVGIPNLYGQNIGIGTNHQRPGRAIWRLTPQEQISIYQHLPDPLEAKRLFISLAQPPATNGGNDLFILHNLRAWIDSGFNGSWQGTTQQ